MSIVTLPTKQPTLEDYAEFQRQLRWFPDGEKQLAAGGYCPFFECVPSEVFDYGATYPGIAFCHHPEGDPESYPVCNGQYCNCQMSIETWGKAWALGYIAESV